MTNAVGEKIPRWELKVDYVETCNCDYGCPCNFSGFPTGEGAPNQAAPLSSHLTHGPPR